MYLSDLKKASKDAVSADSWLEDRSGSRASRQPALINGRPELIT